MAVADHKHNTGNIETNTPQKSASDYEGEKLVEYYNKLFQILPADTPQRLEECFRLRYQVYCLETGFEDKDAFPDGMERDHFDTHSVSSLLIHKPFEPCRDLLVRQ